MANPTWTYVQFSLDLGWTHPGSLLTSAMLHKDQFAEANQKILELERAKQRIEEQIKAWVKIRDGFQALSETINATPLVPTKIGPTEAIRVILGKHPDGLTPTQIREELAGYGISCGSDKNFLGNIHTIIKRSKEIEEVGIGGRKLYKLRDFSPTLGYPTPTNTQKKV